MPASITIALVASSPKVTGSRMLMPASGPMPGSTPTMVPTRQPRNAYHSTSGCSATEKPSSEAFDACPCLESEEAALERRLQRHAEQQIGQRDDADAEGRGVERRAALDGKDQREQQAAPW